MRTALALVPTKVFNPQVLLEGFEKQFDLPAFSVNGGNRAGCELQLVGEQLDFTLVALIPDRHQAQVFPTGRSGRNRIKPDQLDSPSETPSMISRHAAATPKATE